MMKKALTFYVRIKNNGKKSMLKFKLYLSEIYIQYIIIYGTSKKLTDKISKFLTRYYFHLP